MAHFNLDSDHHAVDMKRGAEKQLSKDDGDEEASVPVSVTYV